MTVLSMGGRLWCQVSLKFCQPETTMTKCKSHLRVKNSLAVELRFVLCHSSRDKILAKRIVISQRSQWKINEETKETFDQLTLVVHTKQSKSKQLSGIAFNDHISLDRVYSQGVWPAIFSACSFFWKNLGFLTSSLQDRPFRNPSQKL